MIHQTGFICIAFALLIRVCVTQANVHTSVELLSGYTAGALADQVTTLPGALGPLKSKQFSGYLDISETKALHYMYFESEGNPATDSVIFWTNGGPGNEH